jgi:hypothetical protein
MAKGNLTFSGPEAERYLNTQPGQEFTIESRARFISLIRTDLGDVQALMEIVSAKESEAGDETRTFLKEIGQ